MSNQRQLSTRRVAAIDTTIDKSLGQPNDSLTAYIDAFIFYTLIIYCRVTRNMLAHKSTQLLRVFSDILWATHSEAPCSSRLEGLIWKDLLHCDQTHFTDGKTNFIDSNSNRRKDRVSNRVFYSYESHLRSPLHRINLILFE